MTLKNKLLSQPAIAVPGIIVVLVIVSGVLAFAVHLSRIVFSAGEVEPPPPGMVLAPAGEFWMGSDDPHAAPDEMPKRRVFLPAYYIDKHEVTNREYKKFKPSHAYPKGADDLPATGVLKHEAEAYARFVGKRLPTGAEWEKAARGTDGRLYPWGDEFNPDLCNMKARKAGGKMPVGSFPEGASPYGALDMTGNVWEWVSDVWEDRVGWFGGDTLRRGIIRGGAYNYPAFQGRTSHQAFEDLRTTCNDVGFRCAMDAVRATGR